MRHCTGTPLNAALHGDSPPLNAALHGGSPQCGTARGLPCMGTPLNGHTLYLKVISTGNDPHEIDPFQRRVAAVRLCIEQVGISKE